jgi:S1/P1 Nuclease
MSLRFSARTSPYRQGDFGRELSMRAACSAMIILSLSTVQALAWGHEGHSIVAEIAQRRLNAQALDRVRTLLNGTSMASIASWADDVRGPRHQTYNWHFVDILLAEDTYDPSRDCKLDPHKGDCAIAELARVKRDLVCAPTHEPKAEALKFTIHFVGDIHQPMHTLLEKVGGNTLPVDVFMRGLTCTRTCNSVRSSTNLHEVWDTTLVMKTVWDWGAYITRLEEGWLKSPDPNAEAGTPQDRVEQSDKEARVMWNEVPADTTLTDVYFRKPPRCSISNSPWAACGSRSS